MSLRLFSVPTHWHLSKDSGKEGTPKPHLGRMCFQMLAFAACVSQSVIMIGNEVESARREFLPNYLWGVIRSSQVATCGADCGINFLCLCRLDLAHRNPNPSAEYRSVRPRQRGSWNVFSSLPSSGATQFFFSFREQKNSSFPDSARWGIYPQKTASSAESSKAHNDRSRGSVKDRRRCRDEGLLTPMALSGALLGWWIAFSSPLFHCKNRTHSQGHPPIRNV